MEMFDKYAGQIFDRRYKIKKTIGVGGMAVVFEAYDMLKNRAVAVKMLKDDISGDTQAVKRFINESKAVAMLSHPNIVNIYDVSVKDDLKYIVMELIEGITLKNYMQKKGALSFKEVISITEQILRALEHAHSKGIVHRDIKPQNIMLLKDGTIKVADFGIAKLPNTETVTMTDKAIGTVFYISPEQASGKPIDHRSDLYSLGATMYEMATGKLPFTADSPVSVALMQVKSAPKSPREYNQNIPRGLEQIILISMEKNADHRFQSATQMLRHLLQIKNNPKAVFKISTQSEKGENTTVSPSKAKKAKKSHSFRQGSMFPIIMGISISFLIVLSVSIVMVIAKLNVPQLNETIGLSQPNIEDSGYKRVTVPALTTNKFDENTFNAKWGDDFSFTVESEKYDNSEKGTILEQSPQEGDIKKLKEDEKYEIKLILSLGVERQELKEYKYLYLHDVTKDLEARGFKTKIEKAYHDYIPVSHVIETVPAAGEIAEHGDTITLVVSSGPDDSQYQTTVPNFVGMSEKEAMDKLKACNLKLGSYEYKTDNEHPKGTVIWQSVSENTKVPEGKRIDFRVSKGPKKVKVGNYNGSYYHNATLELENIDLKYELIFEFSDTVKADDVISSSPKAGSDVLPGSVVILTVSKGKDPANELVSVPEFVGTNHEEALIMLENLGLKLGTLEYVEAKEEKGLVIYQSIKADSRVARGTQIDIKVSIGAD